MAESQSFQSLLQLAVALNIGFVAISTVYGSSISKERIKIEELSLSTNMYRNHCVDNNELLTESASLLKKIMRLRQDLRREVTDLDRLVDRYCRPIALFLALSAFIFLVCSSFAPTSNAGTIFPIVSIGVNAPLIGFLGYAYYRSAVVLSLFSKRRQDLDDELTEQLACLM